jgi:hypothetical protein
MGAGRVVAIAALVAAAALPGPRASGATVWDPIARLSLEGGYDSNALYLGRGGDRIGRISPELGLELRDPRWSLMAIYGADYLVYDRLAPNGIWNHRGRIDLDAALSRRLTLAAEARGGYAYDPVGLALMGVFRTGKQSAWTLSGRGRVEYRAAARLDSALTLREQVVRFDDGTGGAMHAPGAELLWVADRRLSLGAAYALGLFQGFELTGTNLSVSNGVRARVRYRVSRQLLANAFAGPALWNGTGGQGFAAVPEVGGELQWATRWWDVRTSAQHALGLGSTARPALVDSVEAAGVRRFGRRFDVRGDAGMWRSGRVPSGRDAVLGYALGGEAGTTFGGGLRLALAATHWARLDDTAARLSRSTIAIRLSWTSEPQR